MGLKFIGIFLKCTHKHKRTTNFVLIFHSVQVSSLDYAKTRTHINTRINAILWAQVPEIGIKFGVGREFWMLREQNCQNETE